MRAPSAAAATNAARYLSTQNPFYVLSAVLVLYGLRQCTAAGGDWTGGWLLMAALSAYALLLAGTAWLIVRFGRVWDDARMILLIIVFLFLALSISFDRIALADPLTGAMFLAVGFIFAATVTEGLLLALQMRLTACYRIPYYLVLALLFGYPVLLGLASVHGYNRVMAWGVYLFPVFGALAMFTLLPAAVVGHRDRRPSGTPWTWPLYPWTLFFFLWVSLALRSYSVCFVFEARAGWHPDFQPHYLSPLLLAAAVLLLELGWATGSRVTRRAALLMPLGMLPLAMLQLGGGSGNTEFAPMLCTTLGSPLFLAVWSFIVFYGIAWARGVRPAEMGLYAALALAGFVARQTVEFRAPPAPQVVPLCLLALLLIGAGILQELRWKIVAGGTLAVLMLAGRFPDVTLEMASLHRGFYVLHAAVLCILFAALYSEERWACAVKDAAVVVLPLASFLAGLTYHAIFPDVPITSQLLYLLGLAVLAWGYWHAREEPQNLLAAMLSTLSLAILPGGSLYDLLQATALAKAVPWVAVGLLLFAVALVISLYKGGILRDFWPLLRRVNLILRGSTTS